MRVLGGPRVDAIVRATSPYFFFATILCRKGLSMRRLLRLLLMLLLVLAPAAAGCSSKLSEKAAEDQSSADEYADGDEGDQARD